MTTLQENERLEYEALMARGRDAEWTSQISWVVCGVAATALLAWGIATRNATLMLPVVIATAYGFYAMLRGRQQHYAAHFRQPKSRAHVKSDEDALHSQDVGGIFLDQPTH